MIIVIDGNEPFLIERKLNELIKGCENVIRLNGNDSDFSIETLMEACDTNSLFSDLTRVLVNEPSFLIKKEKGEEKEEKNTVLFENYIDNPNYACDLIIYTYNSNFNKTSKIYKHLQKNAEEISLNSLDPNNFYSQARSIVKDSGIKMTQDAFALLVKNSGTSTSNFVSYLDLLKNYPDTIDEKCIAALTQRQLDSDIFDLINALALKKTTRAVKILRDLYASGNSVFMIISVLAGQLRFLYQVDYYRSNRYSVDDIADLLKCKKYRVQKSLENLTNLNHCQIIDLLNRLSEIDINNKSDSSITPEERFELYIIKNFRNKYE